jgi:vacuolar-type H+-ATPase subunit F/Vma7
VRTLELKSYVKAVSTQNTRAGFEATIYELTKKAYLVLMLNSTNLESLVNRIDDNIASQILAAIVEASSIDDDNFKTL